MNTSTKVMIVEDQAMPRQLFESFVKGSPNYELVASIDNASVADIYCLRYAIDLVIMDVVTKNGASGLDAAKKIKKNNPRIKIIIVTSMPECSYVNKAHEIGVEGFWYKELNDEPVLSIMKQVMEGKIVYPDSSPNVSIGLTFSKELTERELEVLREMTGGYNNNEIAERLAISISTVKSHIEHLLQKTGFKNRIELAVKARETGLVILDRDEK